MSRTLQQVKAKADATNVAERAGGAGSSTAELEEIELQMLRGIFAAHDENKDGVINKSQLAEALVSLGYSPTEKLMTKFFLENAKSGKKHWRISLETFLSAASKWLDSADDCSADVMYLFEMFDKTKSGSVSAQVVRHLLHETVAPTRLTRQETEEFMKYSDVGGKGANMRLKTPVDYEDLVDKLMF
jgi:Ca2+-binding EF-hand superfamily protein